MHLRLLGKLVFKREQNSYFYQLDQALLTEKGNSKPHSFRIDFVAQLK